MMATTTMTVKYTTINLLVVGLGRIMSVSPDAGAMHSRRITPLPRHQLSRLLFLFLLRLLLLLLCLDHPECDLLHNP